MDHGRSRESIADIEEQLTELFAAMSSTTQDENGDPVIPHADLPAMLAEYAKRHGTQLLSPDGEVAVQEFLETHRDYKVTPAFMLHLIAMMAPSKTASSENPAPQPTDDNPGDPRSDSSGASSPDADFRGRGEGSPNHSVSLSRHSSNSSFHGPGAPSTPLSSGRVASSSPFDSTARRRSTPLSAAAPSAWTRKPLPASRRRKSDAGSASGNRSSSDNETTPAIARGPRRSRAPSNPVSPSHDSFPPTAFPTSRSGPAHSPDNSLINASKRSHSFDQSIGMSQTLVDPDFSYDRSKRTPALKFHSSGSDSDTDREPSDEEDSTHRYVRPALSSDASLAPQDLLEALQKSHADLARKAADSEKRMQNRLAERETEIADLEAQLDDLKTELSASRREEKELRVKERANMTQFATFESEILKLTKNLEHSRAQYSSMQKQYQEQCAETERMRNLLRRKEQELKEADDRGFAHEGEVQKWSREREALENSIETLEAELSITRQAVNELDEQKQENLLLKETIDRMRFDLDALRAGMGPSSAQEGQGTLSRSLANEIRAGFERREREREEAQDEDEVEGVVVEHHDGEGSDDGYIETTITTSRKRVGTRKPIPRLDDGNLREYVDVSTQHEESEFLTTAAVQCQQSVSNFGTQHQSSEFANAAEIQTEARVLLNAEISTDSHVLQDVATETEPPRVQDIGIETEVREVKHVESGTETPEVREVQTEAWSGVERSVGPDDVQGVETGVGTEAPDVTYAEIGTEAETTPEMCEVEVQTDPEPIQSSRRPVPTAVIDVVPGPSDLPPPYPHAAESGVLKRWHARRSHHAPGSVHAREEWAALKRLVGVDCQVIERAIEGQDVENMVEDKDDEHVETPPSRARKLFRISFEFTSWPYLLTHAVMGFGVWSLAAAVVVNQLVPQTPTYTDRMNWSAYNNYAGALGEGLVGRGGDGALWSMVERLVLGAAVRVGPGMPT